LEPYPPP